MNRGVRVHGLPGVALAILIAGSGQAAEGSAWRVSRGEVRVLCPLTVGGSFEARTTSITGALTPASTPAVMAGILVRPLGVIAATITPELLSGLGNLRVPSGVVVVARTADPTSVDLSSGDVIHAVNSTAVTSVEALRDLLTKLNRGDAVVLQVERRGGLEFVAFEMN